jgi:hypothetical protein
MYYKRERGEREMQVFFLVFLLKMSTVVFSQKREKERPKKRKKRHSERKNKEEFKSEKE